MHTIFIHNNSPKSYKELEKKMIKKFEMIDGDQVQIIMGKGRTKPYVVPVHKVETKGWLWWKKSKEYIDSLELNEGDWIKGTYHSDGKYIRLKFGGKW
jgi:hypothetical protein